MFCHLHNIQNDVDKQSAVQVKIKTTAKINNINTMKISLLLRKVIGRNTQNKLDS